MTTFTDLGVAAPIISALDKVGITDAFQIQELCIPQALEGRDLIGQAKTGTGKTLGFGIPLLQRIATPGTPEYAELSPAEEKAPKALVVVPTRELCVQVTDDLTHAGSELGARVLSIYGGRAYEPQVEALKKGVDVVVGTPGRVIDLAKQRILDLSHVRVLVLDEADEMLDMGFLPDVERIVSMLPATRQTMLFSATMPGQIISLARRYMTQPTHIRALNLDDDSATVSQVEQHVWRVHPLNKVEILARVMQAEGDWLGALEAFELARQLAIQFDATDLDDLLVEIQLVRLWLAQGKVSQARRWLEARGPFPAHLLPPGEVEDVFDYHLQKYERIVAARIDLALGQPEAALAMLEPLLALMERRGLSSRRMIEIYNLKALALQALGRETEALDNLEKALARGEPGRFVRSFVDEGQPMADLLRLAANRGIRPGYAARLLSAFEAPDLGLPPDLTAAAAQPLVEPLSERELEVLQLLSTSLSNPEIADRLFIAPSTVRSHVKNIYGKLDVHKRWDAVARGRELGLIR